MGGGWSKARIARFSGLRSHANGARNLVTAGVPEKAFLKQSVPETKEKARRSGAPFVVKNYHLAFLRCRFFHDFNSATELFIFLGLNFLWFFWCSRAAAVIVIGNGNCIFSWMPP